MPTTDWLIPSTQDDIELCREVAIKCHEIQGLKRRLTGTDLVAIGSDIISAIALFRKMRKRHMKGDYRHTESEYQALKIVAQWSLDVYLHLRNQPPREISWPN